MKIFVYNCFHWIGFHILDNLLLNGYNVFGFHDHLTEKEQFLSLFLGRNNNFKKLNKIEGEYVLSIIINDTQKYMNIHSEKEISFMVNNEANDLKNSLQLPLLFGEWMQMDQEGIYVGGEHILFDSDKFLKNAIYIQTFVDQLIKYIKEIENTCDDNLINIDTKDFIFDNSIYIRDNTSIQEKVRELIAHYKSFQTFYHL